MTLIWQINSLRNVFTPTFTVFDGSPTVSNIVFLELSKHPLTGQSVLLGVFHTGLKHHGLFLACEQAGFVAMHDPCDLLVRLG